MRGGGVDNFGKGAKGRSLLLPVIQNGEWPRRSSSQTTSTSLAHNPARQVFRPARSPRPPDCLS